MDWDMCEMAYRKATQEGLMGDAREARVEELVKGWEEADRGDHDSATSR